MNPTQTPTFVVIGQPNEGKTTVLATLTENDTAEIGPIPGNTQRCVRYPYKVDDRDILLFYDTPGFQRPGKMLEWFSKQDDNKPDLAKRFLAEFAHDKVFHAECEILKPIVNGAAVLYIADASRGVGKADRQALEILRKCGNPRIGIINSKDKAKAYFNEWKQFMRKDFNHCREFNGHRGSFRDRRELLEAVGAVVSEWSAPMREVLAALDSDWNARLAQIADMIIDLLTKVLTAQEEVTVQKAGKEDHAKKKAKEKLEEKIREFERSCRLKILEVFKHSKDHWKPSKLEKMDLFSEEAWKLFGLSKQQLAFVFGIVGGGVGAGIGAGIGFQIDVLALGSTGGLGTAIGAGVGGIVGIVGGLGALGAADHAVDFKVPWALRWAWGGKKLGGRTSIAKIKPASNLPWVLISRSLIYAEEASHWAHGKRTATELQLADDNKISVWEKSELKTISEFIHQICADKKDQTKYQDAKKSVRLLLVSKLKQLTE